MTTQTAYRTGRVAVSWLRNQFPVLGEFQPLKIGIYHDLNRLPIRVPVLRASLRLHTTSFRYLENLKMADSMRYDLAGVAVESATDADRKTAAASLKHLKKKVAAKRKSTKGQPAADKQDAKKTETVVPKILTSPEPCSLKNDATVPVIVKRKRRRVSIPV